MLSGIVTLLLFTVLGEAVSVGLQLMVPGSVIGLILLTVYLQCRGGASESLEAVSQFCIRYLAVLFLPSSVGIFFLGDLLSEQWLPIALVILVATPISIVLIGRLVQYLFKRDG